jgi:hypothetical protein
MARRYRFAEVVRAPNKKPLRSRRLPGLHRQSRACQPEIYRRASYMQPIWRLAVANHPHRKLTPDGLKMKEAIAWCLASGVRFRRCSQHQIKMGQVSFWPTTGKIVLDGGYVHPHTGLEVFQQIALRLAALAGGRAQVRGAPSAVTEEPISVP